MPKSQRLSEKHILAPMSQSDAGPPAGGGAGTPAVSGLQGTCGLESGSREERCPWRRCSPSAQAQEPFLP